MWGNTVVNISGSNLADGTTAVFFGTTPAAAFSIISPSQIMALSPAGAGTVDVTVVTAGGSSPIVPAVEFTYLAVTLTWDGAPRVIGPTRNGPARACPIPMAGPMRLSVREVSSK